VAFEEVRNRFVGAQMTCLSENQIKTMCRKIPVFAQMVECVRIRDESTRKYRALLKDKQVKENIN